MNNLLGHYRIADICFPLGKYQSLRSGISSEFSFTTTVKECKHFSEFQTSLPQLHNVKYFSERLCGDFCEGYGNSHQGGVVTG